MTPSNSRQWLPKDDEILLDLVIEYPESSWAELTAKFNNDSSTSPIRRTHHALSSRFAHLIKHQKARAGGPKRVRKSGGARNVPPQGKRRSKRIKQENKRRAVAVLESDGDESGVEVVEPGPSFNLPNQANPPRLADVTNASPSPVMRRATPSPAAPATPTHTPAPAPALAAPLPASASTSTLTPAPAGGMSAVELLGYQKRLLDERQASRDEHRKVAERQDKVVETLEELIKLGQGRSE